MCLCGLVSVCSCHEELDVVKDKIRIIKGRIQSSVALNPIIKTVTYKIEGWQKMTVDSCKQ